MRSPTSPSLAILCVVFAWLAGAVHAQTWPARVINLVVPYAPGGATDLLGRAVAQKLGDALGQPVVVVKRAGLRRLLGVFDRHRLRATGSRVQGLTANSCVTCMVELRPTNCTGSRAGSRLAGFAHRLRGRPLKSCRNERSC